MDSEYINNRTEIFISSLPDFIRASSLRSYFSQIGEVTEIKMIFSERLKHNKGKAQISFKQPIKSRFLEKTHTIEEEDLEIKLYYSDEQPFFQTCCDKFRKIFVGGLPFSTEGEDLVNYFENFGEVEEAKIVYNTETKKSRGFAFVLFKHERSAELVLYKYDNHYLGGKWIDCKQTYQKDDFQMVITSYGEESNSDHSDEHSNS